MANQYTNPWTDEELNFLFENYASLGCREVSKQLNRSYGSVLHKARRNNLSVSKETYSKNRSNAIRNYWDTSKKTNSRIDHSIFIDNINKYSAYILGFWWADGYLYEPTKTITMTIVREDFNDIKKCFEETGDWCYTNTQQEGRKPQSGMRNSNRFLFDFLIDCNYHEKSFACASKVLNHIPNELQHYWWRGYFDGDGCLYLSPDKKFQQIIICSTIEQDWHFCCNLMDSLEVTYSIAKNYHKSSNSHSSKIRTTGVHNCYRFMNYIYQDYDGIGLSRKYNKYLDLLDYYNSTPRQIKKSKRYKMGLC